MPKSVKEKPSLALVIAQALSWKRHKQGGFVARLPGQRTGIVYTRDEFDALDPRYLSVIEQLKKNKGLAPYGCGPEVTAHVLRVSQHHWTTTSLRTLALPLRVLGVLTIDRVITPRAPADTAVLMMSTYDIRTLPSGVVFGCQWIKQHTTPVPYATLESWSPGAVTRMLHAADLGLSEEEIAQHAFAESAGTSQALPVDFSIV